MAVKIEDEIDARDPAVRHGFQLRILRSQKVGRRTVAVQLCVPFRRLFELKASI